YFWIYDYGNRQGLLGAYHEQACLSLSIPFNPKDPAPSCMWQYFKDSRNMIKLRDPYVRYQLLRHTNLDIVSTLCVLPQTRHDLGSFLVDLWVHTESMLCFSVHGVFKEGREMEEKHQYERRQDWFKITIPNGMKYDKTWLLDLLQTYCSVPFIPVDFHYMKYGARFYIQGAIVAAELKDANYEICDEDNKKISIYVCPSPEPLCLQNKLKPKEAEQLKLQSSSLHPSLQLTMYKLYDSSQQYLDLQNLCLDPDLEDHDIDIILNRGSCMSATLHIIEQNFPELLSLSLQSNELYQLDGLSEIVQMIPTVKILNLSKNELSSVEELGKMKGLKLEELWLDGNPLCDTFPDRSSYVRYYLIYDYGARQDLLSVYHEEACFSLTVPFSSEDPAPSGLEEYLKYSRNMKTLENPDLQFQLLKSTKQDIVDSLCTLPRTQHDLNSYVVELCMQTVSACFFPWTDQEGQRLETMLYFSVNGVFKELEGNSQGSVRAFTRTFVLTPDTSSGLYIVNDELILKNTSTKETQSTIFMPGPSCQPVLSLRQQEMVEAFSTEFGMNLQWAQKYLQDNDWDYTRAGQIFTMHKVGSGNQGGYDACLGAWGRAKKNEGKIPEEAFKPAP
ncbi:Nuclear RNA export factor 2, partial [Galemys pyrenaicus]